MRRRNCDVLGGVQSPVFCCECSKDGTTHAGVAHGNVGIDKDDAVSGGVCLTDDPGAHALAQVEPSVSLWEGRVTHHVGLDDGPSDIGDTQAQQIL